MFLPISTRCMISVPKTRLKLGNTFSIIFGGNKCTSVDIKIFFSCSTPRKENDIVTNMV